MRRRDLFVGLWKRVEETRDELLAEGTANRERAPEPEQDRKRISEQLDAGGAIQLPRYNHPAPPPPDEPEP